MQGEKKHSGLLAAGRIRGIRGIRWGMMAAEARSVSGRRALVRRGAEWSDPDADNLPNLGEYNFSSPRFPSPMIACARPGYSHPSFSTQ